MNPVRDANSICSNGGEIEIEWEERDSAIYMTAKHPEFDFDSLKISFYNHGEQNCQYHIGYINEGEKRKWQHYRSNPRNGISRLLLQDVLPPNQNQWPARYLRGKHLC
ncbi:hypothetical protein L4D76_22330 [Photobacterium sagamiensis]|uniref:hypothetical protein n=1 Tax=Photobacterium sagamiensis TaxID=2910241 RepID=UPI003D0C363D